VAIVAMAAIVVVIAIVAMVAIVAMAAIVAMVARSMGSSFSPAGRRSCSIKARCEAKRSSSLMQRTWFFISSSLVANGRTVFRPVWNYHHGVNG
jgi:hypothetical protein